MPRADQLFAGPRQRFDLASERLRHALARNLQEHRHRFVEAASKLQAKALQVRLRTGSDRSRVSAERLAQAYRTRLNRERQHLTAIARLLDGVSYRAALERGFALVRGPDGHVHRRAATIASGEKLTITFADGDAKAVATESGEPAGTKPGKPRKAKDDQGTLL